MGHPKEAADEELGTLKENTQDNIHLLVSETILLFE
jgi:hypothetical protein